MSTESREPIDYTVSGMYQGYQVTVQLTGRPESALPQIVKRLAELGIEPMPAAPSAPASSAAAPTCPVHGRPMKPMTKPDRQGRTHWCTCKTDAGFCQERA